MKSHQKTKYLGINLTKEVKEPYAQNYMEFLDGLMVKDPALLLLWCRFDSWPWNFCMPWAWPKKPPIKHKEN